MNFKISIGNNQNSIFSAVVFNTFEFKIIEEKEDCCIYYDEKTKLQVTTEIKNYGSTKRYVNTVKNCGDSTVILNKGNL